MHNTDRSLCNIVMVEQWKEFTPFNGTLAAFKQYEKDLLSYASGITDDSGSNLAQTLEDTDMVQDLVLH